MSKDNTLSSKIRLLQVIPSLDIGGAQRFLVDLVKALDKKKFYPAVCVLGKKRNTFLEDELEKKDIPIFFLNLRWAFHPFTILRLSRLFTSFKPDIIHTHLRAIRYVLIPSLLTKVPVHIHTIHNLAKQDTSFFYRPLNKIAFKYLGVKTVSISREVARTVKDVYGIDSIVIYNGIPTQEYACRKEEESKDDVISLINVGKFKKAKNHFLLIESFAIALEKEPKLRLVLVGDGSLRRRVEERVKQLGLSGKVVFLGWREDVSSVLNNSDIFVLSSAWEGFGMVLVEAMAAGKPVVATKVGGVPEVVEEGLAGILVPPQDPVALAEAILTLAENKDLRKIMGQKGEEIAKKKFDILLIAPQYEELYERELKARSG